MTREKRATIQACCHGASPASAVTERVVGPLPGAGHGTLSAPEGEASLRFDFPLHRPQLIKLFRKVRKSYDQHAPSQGIGGDGEDVARELALRAVDGQAAGAGERGYVPLRKGGAEKGKAVDQTRGVSGLRRLCVQEPFQPRGGESLGVLGL